jgi:putative ABC transport system permease protein
MLQNYLAAALRNMERNGLYAGMTVAGLAIGFAAALLIALFVRDEYSYDRFVSGREQVYRISETIKEPGERVIVTDTGPTMVAPALKLDFPQIQYVARLSGAAFPASVRRGDFVAAEQDLHWADPDFFRVMPMPTIAGDLASALDAPDGIVLTRSVARKYFGRDTPIGQILLINQRPMKVTAVIEDLPSQTHLTANMFASGRSPDSEIAKAERVDSPLNNNTATYFRLRPGASAADLEPGLPGFVLRHFALARFGGQWAKTRIDIHLVPLADIHLTPSTQGAFKPAGDKAIIAAIGGVGVLIVLVASINFVTLMTARAARRAVEVGVRKAAGARRSDLIVQFMGEALVYVILAAVLATALAELSLPGFNALLQRRIVFDYLHDASLAGGMLLAMLIVAVLAGAYPALVLSAFRPSAVLKGGLVQTTGGGGVRQALVIIQFAVLIGLVLFAVTITRQTVYALNEGMRLDKDQVLFLAAEPCTDTLRDAMRALPGVRQAACSSAYALGMSEFASTVTIDSRRSQVDLAPVDFGFFDVYGVKPLAGRLFDPHRPADGYIAGSEINPPAVINETAVKKLGFTSAAAAIGHTVTWNFHVDLAAPCCSEPQRPSQIIGVVPDFTFASMRAPIAPVMYVVGPKVGYYSIALNLKLDDRRIPETLQGIDRLWKRMQPDHPIQRVFVTLFTMRLYIDTITQGALIAVAAVVAVTIAALGLFGLSAYTTERRTKEIGVRKAMGAGTGDILRLLMWQFTQPVLWANLIAWPVSFLVLRWWLQGFAYHVDLAPWTFVAAAAGALLIAWATVFVHALRVARAKPVLALRYE